MSARVIVIGAGPIGLSSGARLLAVGIEPMILEAGAGVGSTVRDWSHVRVFTDWDSVIDPIAADLLAETGWDRPPGGEFPTGGDLVSDYLEPLGDAMAQHVLFDHTVTAISRKGRDKLVTSRRDQLPFVVRATFGGEQVELEADFVIDASGTWGTPNPMGADGLPVIGEEEAVAVRYGMPDVIGDDRSRYAGKRTVVVGAGHSAANVLLDLAELALEEPGTQPIWAIRRPDPLKAYGAMEEDELPERGKVGLELRHRVEEGRIELVPGFLAKRVFAGGIAGETVDGDEIEVEADEVVVATGQRPDLSMTRELRLELDPLLESPVKLAPLIDPNVHTCLTVPPHGVEHLSHPEPGFFTVGIKSYGRAPTFLMKTGYGQVESVVGAIVTGSQPRPSS